LTKVEARRLNISGSLYCHQDAAGGQEDQMLFKDGNDFVEVLLRAQETGREREVLAELGSRQEYQALRALITRLLQSEVIDENLWQIFGKFAEWKTPFDGGGYFCVASYPSMQRNPAHAYMQQQQLVYAANKNLLRAIREATSTDARMKLLEELRIRIL
jgi:hypothetical protein